MYIDVRDPDTNKLLFRFDPCRDLVEIKSRGRTNLIDLTTIREAQAQPEKASTS